MSKLMKFLFFVGAPIFLGALIYYIFCPGTVWALAIDKILKINLHILIDTDKLCVRIVRFYLLDFLWGFALASAVFLIYEGTKHKEKKLVGIITFEVVMESIQLMPWVMGTFDFFDIVVEIFAGILAYYFLQEEDEL